MRTYKGYLIEQLTRVDYIVRDMDGNRVELPEGKWSFRTIREAKNFIDGIK